MHFSNESYIEFKFFVPLFQIENWTRYLSTRVPLFTKKTSLYSSTAILPQKNMKKFLIAIYNMYNKNLEMNFILNLLCVLKKLSKLCLFSVARVALPLKYNLRYLNKVKNNFFIITRKEQFC